MKTNNLKKSLADIRMIKAQFDELYKADPTVGKFMHSLLCDMSEQKITPDDFFASFCYATFEHHNKHGEMRCENTKIIPDTPCPTCPLRADEGLIPDTKHTPEYGSVFAKTPPAEVLLQDLSTEFRTHLANAQKYINENKELVDSELVLDIADDKGSLVYRIGIMVPACAVEALS